MPVQPSDSAPTRRCGQPGPREELLAESGFDLFERQALDLMRLIFADMSGGQPRHARAPSEVAQALFGPIRGDALFLGLSALVRTMAMARAEPFRYSNPYCDGCARVLTRDERNLLAVLHHVRRSARGAATAHAIMLCEARPVAGLLDVAADLARLVPLAASATR